MPDIEFNKLESKPLCGTIGCQNYASYVCWTQLTNDFDEIEGLLVMRPLLMCKPCLRQIGGKV